MIPPSYTPARAPDNCARGTMPPPCLGETHGKKYKSPCVLEGQGLILERIGLLGCLLGCPGGGLWLSWCLVGVLEAS